MGKSFHIDKLASIFHFKYFDSVNQLQTGKLGWIASKSPGTLVFCSYMLTF